MAEEIDNDFAIKSRNIARKLRNCPEIRVTRDRISQRKNIRSYGARGAIKVGNFDANSSILLLYATEYRS